MKPIHVVAYGKPEPAGSKTAGVSKTGKPYVRPVNPNQKDWQRTVAQAAGEAMNGHEPLVGPVELTVTFFLPRPKSHYGSGRNVDRLKPSAPTYPTVKPDRTKLLRAVEDALKGICWRDDSQVVAGDTLKRYGTPVRAEIVVEEITCT